MKKTYFEPEMGVSVMSLKCSILEESPANTGLDPSEETTEGGEDTNKRNAGRDATWGNLW